MSNERQYAAERIRSIASTAAEKIKEQPIHTNEVFALYRKFKVAPPTPKMYWAKVRELAKARRFGYPPPIDLNGDVSGLAQGIEQLMNAKYEAAEKIRREVFSKAEMLADYVVLDQSLEPKEGVQQMRTFAKNFLRNNS